jgi:hypothetical protein
VHDEQIKTYFDGSFYALYLEYKGEVDVPLSFSVFMRSKPFWVKSSHKVVSCICVHHRSMVLRAKALAKLRKTTHRHPQDDSKVRSKGCTHDTSCACTCKVCEAPTKGAQLGDFKDTVMCPRVGDARHYDVACVLGKCKLCGIARKLKCCPIEVARREALVTTKTLGKVQVDTPKGSKTIAAIVEKEQHLKEFMEDTAKEATLPYPTLPYPNPTLP